MEAVQDSNHCPTNNMCSVYNISQIVLIKMQLLHNKTYLSSLPDSLLLFFVIDST